jgi:hypothetical protein
MRTLDLHHLRYGSAVVLLTAVLAVIASPLWHHGHHPMAEVVNERSGDELAIHLCSTGGHAVHVTQCPVCLSQRLLGQSDTEASTQPAAPSRGVAQPISWVFPTSVSIFHDALARAPPRV